MGINCASLVADMFYCFAMSLSDNNQVGVIEILTLPQISR